MTKKKWIILVIGLVLIVGYLLMGDSSTPENKISKEPVKDEKNEEKMDAQAELKEAAMTLYSQDETTKWELKANSIEHFADSKQIKLKEVSAEIYEEDQQVVTLTAKEGILDTKTNFLELIGPLTIKSGAKVIKANHLNWNTVKNQLIGSGNVLLKQQGLKVRGEKFISQIDLNRLRVLENVHVTSRKEDDKNEK